MALFRYPVVSMGQRTVALFDVGGAVAAAGLIVVFVVSVRQNATALAMAEQR
jgi:hypothetical protein